MTAPARGGEIVLRPALARDCATILALEEAGMRLHAEALWGNWIPSAMPETLDPGGHEMIEWGGRTVGVVATGLHDDHLRIGKLYIAPEVRNLGLGTRILNRKIAEAALLGLPVRLSVLTTNPALRFYRRAGFDIAHSTAERHFLIRAATPPASG